MTQRKSALPAATGKDAKGEKLCWLHITTSRPVCQILRGVIAWVSVVSLLGIIGGMEQETIRFVPGMIWAAAMLILFGWGSRPWQS